MDPTPPQMSPEGLLEALGGIAREQDASSEAWEAVAAGTRDGEDVRREREALDGPELSQAYAELFQPVAPGERERVTDLLAATLSQQGTEERGDDSSVAEERDETASSGEKPASLTEYRSRRGRWIAGLTTLVAAAGLVVWLLPASPTTLGVQLPPYSLTVRNRTVATSRAGDDGNGPARYRPDSQVEWVVSPETQHSAAVGIAFLALSEPEAASTPVFGRIKKVQLQASGAVTIRGTVEELLGLPSGRWRVHLMVADPNHLPATAQAAIELVSVEAPEDVQVTRPAYVIEIEPANVP
ncbi:MAG: hypothetical protein ACPG4T_12620 [Nannocystaceae bacterium]